MKEIKSWQETLTTGWARHPLWAFERHGSAHEVDCYYITDAEEAWTIRVSILETGQLSEYRISFHDRKTGETLEKTVQRHFHQSRYTLNETSGSDESVHFSCDDIRMAFIRKDSRRNLLFCAPDLVFPGKGKGLDARFILSQPDDLESLCTMRVRRNSRHSFLYERRLNCMSAEGTLRLGDVMYELKGRSSLTAELLSIRGHLPQKNPRLCLSCCTYTDGRITGLDLTAGGESAVVIGNRIHKLGAVKEENRRFTTSDGKLDIAFESTYRPEDRRDTAYGWCSGKLVLGDGTEVTVPRTPAFIVPGR